MQFALQHQSSTDPAAVAALIAAGASFLALIVQFYGIRRVSRDTETIVHEQLGQERLRTLNERFATAADRLGTDKSAAVRLGAVFAMAGLADDWPERRQTCVDVLCNYLRLPYDPDPGKDGSQKEKLAFQGDQQVRHTIIGIIAAHLRDGAEESWQGLNLDLRGVVFDGGDFRGVRFTGRKPNRASETVLYSDDVRFDGAVFASGAVGFDKANFSGGRVSFRSAIFCGSTVSFRLAKFTGAQVSFEGATFSGGDISFHGAAFESGLVTFAGLGQSDLEPARFAGAKVSFRNARFEGGNDEKSTVIFCGSEFSDGMMTFHRASFRAERPRFFSSTSHTTYIVGKYAVDAGRVYFTGARFLGGQLDLRNPLDWFHPPIFGLAGHAPDGVMLPEGYSIAQEHTDR